MNIGKMSVKEKIIFQTIHKQKKVIYVYYVHVYLNYVIFQDYNISQNIKIK